MFTLDLAIVCVTMLAALWMFRNSVERLTRHKYTIFALFLPFGVTWTFAGGDNPNEVQELLRRALESRAPKPKALKPVAVGNHTEPKRPPLHTVEKKQRDRSTDISPE